MAIEYPIVQLFGYPKSRNSYEFLGREGKIEIGGYNHRAFAKLLSYMNGRLSLKEIAQKTKQLLPREDLMEVISALSSVGIIADSRNLFEQFHQDSANPADFGHCLSSEEIAEIGKKRAFPEFGTKKVQLSQPSGEFCSLLQRRQSQRNFSGKPIGNDQLSNLLCAMYGKKPCQSVPSAGGLYPMALFVQVLAGVRGLKRGLYRYDPDSHGLELQKSMEAYELYSIFDAVSLCDRAAALLFVVANLSHTTQKYANRGYRYALLEAGHMCQNGYVSAVEQDMGAVEIGGYHDETLAALLGLHYPAQAVLSTLFVGKNEKTPRFSHEISPLQFNDLYIKMVRETKYIKSVETITPGSRLYQPSFVAARCVYRTVSNGKVDHSFANGKTAPEAQFKAMVEAYERIACSHTKIGMISAPNQLGAQFLDPGKYLPLQQKQKALNGVPNSLSAGMPIEWVTGRFLRGSKKILVPSDMVYYPLDFKSFGRNIIYHADSSGVAAHTKLRSATRNALFELIERDALMLHWYCNLRAKKLPSTIASAAISKSVSYWENQGVSVDFLDITIDSIPVVLVAIHSPEVKPYFVTGAAASMDYASAAQKAFAEAELMWLSWRQVRIPKIQEMEVKHPKDHAVLYMRSEYKEMLGDFLVVGEDRLRTIKKANLLKLFDPIRIVIDNGKNPYGLVVVRVLSEHLMPINFGFGTESRKHRRIKALGLQWIRGFPSQPHFFA